MPKTIDRLVINSPFAEPSTHWRYDRTTQLFELVATRRPAGYVIADPSARGFDDPGVFREIALVNEVRSRVAAWRTGRYDGVTPTTRRLLEYWLDPTARGDGLRLFFCQLEAIETMIWLTEAAPAERQPILDRLGDDGSPFRRLCCKLATGGGKTTVMAMAIAWHVLNRAANPTDRRFAKHVLVIAPGLTVRKRLQVLLPSSDDNYYQRFGLVPDTLMDRMRQGQCVLVRNWHSLAWDREEKVRKRRTVDRRKRSVVSDERYARDVLQAMAEASNLLVINDEAHHAWRVAPGTAGIDKEAVEEATVWIGGLDRIHRTRGILACYDFSATPFVPSGKSASEEALFPWIVSDFGLNDAIECGMVKTPRVVVRDDGQLTKELRSKLFHIYAQPEVRNDLNQRGALPETPLPDLVLNAYALLGKDWRETKRAWQEAGMATPPVMISVVNRTETAARIKHTFDRGRILIAELCDPARTLHIDSKVLEQAEESEEPVAVDVAAAPAGGEGDDGGGDDDGDGARRTRKLTKKEIAESLRQMVDTVGQAGKPGGHLQNVISVGMLSEGWDARTVTHVLGLRAFSSQLLCEQVVGRGLRRTSYDVDAVTGLFEPEYVNVFGVPFTFLPHEDSGDRPPPPPKPKTEIKALPERSGLAITWPNVLRIERVYRERLEFDLEACGPLDLDTANIRLSAELAAVVEGKPRLDQLTPIELQALGRELRPQRIVFDTAARVFDAMQREWHGNREVLIAQLIRIVEGFLRSPKLRVIPSATTRDDLRWRLVVALNMQSIVQHVWQQIARKNAEELELVLDPERALRSTRDMLPWQTTRRTQPVLSSHISHVVVDSTWEATEAFELERLAREGPTQRVTAWAKNDHLGFEILYVWRGSVHRYRPDFLVRLASGGNLIVEVKGRETPQDQTKREAVDLWARAVNAHGGFGRWEAVVSRHPQDLRGLIEEGARRDRAHARATWSGTKTDLENQQDVDLSSLSVAARLALVWDLTCEAWALSGRRMPEYARSQIPGRVWRPGEQRPDG